MLWLRTQRESGREAATGGSSGFSHSRSDPADRVPRVGREGPAVLFHSLHPLAPLLRPPEDVPHRLGKRFFFFFPATPAIVVVSKRVRDNLSWEQYCL
ncbi:unnamed protein product [Ectocarpus sp. 6 AP-2014]